MNGPTVSRENRYAAISSAENTDAITALRKILCSFIIKGPEGSVTVRGQILNLWSFLSALVRGKDVTLQLPFRPPRPLSTTPDSIR